MAKHKRKPLPIADGTAFIETLEQAVEDGNADLISANLPKLKDYVTMYQNRIFQLAKIQFRACTILEQHEPTFEERMKG